MRVFGVMWLTFGVGFLTLTAFAGRLIDEPVTVYCVAVPVMWATAGLVTLAAAARQPRTVRADPAGVHLDRGRVSFVAWRDILRTQTVPTGLDVHDVWLETTDNQLVRLPSRVPAGTVETWRYDPSFTLVRATVDQAVRADALTDREEANVVKFVDRAEVLAERRGESASATLRAQARQLPDADQQALATELLRLADDL